MLLRLSSNYWAHMVFSSGLSSLLSYDHMHLSKEPAEIAVLTWSFSYFSSRGNGDESLVILNKCSVSEPIPQLDHSKVRILSPNLTSAN